MGRNILNSVSLLGICLILLLESFNIPVKQCPEPVNRIIILGTSQASVTAGRMKYTGSLYYTVTGGAVRPNQYIKTGGKFICVYNSHGKLMPSPEDFLYVFADPAKQRARQELNLGNNPTPAFSGLDKKYCSAAGLKPMTYNPGRSAAFACSLCTADKNFRKLIAIYL